MSNKSYFYKFTITIFSFIVVSLIGCSNSPTAGGTIETTNGIVAGVVHDLSNKVLENSSVLLIPNTYNPALGDSSKLRHSATDKDGIFKFTEVGIGEYSVYIIDSAKNSGAIQTGYSITTSSDSLLQNIYLTLLGAFTLKLPDSILESSRFYFTGTPFSWDKMSLSISNNGDYIFTNIPKSSLLPLQWENNDIIKSITDSINIISDDTIFSENIINTDFPDSLTWKVFTKNNSSLPDDSITAITFNKYSNELIFSTRTSGLSIHSKENQSKNIINKSRNVELISNKINAIEIAKDSILWIGTANGINLYDGKTDQLSNFSLNSSLPSLNVTAFAIDSSNDGIWIGTSDSLVYYDKQAKTLNKIFSNALSKKHINNLIVSKDSVLWIATDDGLATYNPKTTFWSVFTTANGLSQNNTISIEQVSNGDIWIGHEDGSVSIYDGVNWVIVPNTTTTSNSKILTIFEANSGVIYLGTLNGLIKHSKPSSWISLNGSNQFDKLPECSIKDIYEDSDANIWLATDRGLYIFGEKVDNIKIKF